MAISTKKLGGPARFGSGHAINAKETIDTDGQKAAKKQSRMKSEIS